MRTGAGRVIQENTSVNKVGGLSLCAVDDVIGKKNESWEGRSADSISARSTAGEELEEEESFPII